MPWTRWAATLVGVGALVVLVVVERHTLHQSIDVFGHLRWRWVPLAVLAETISMTVFALAQRHLVVVGGHRTPVGHSVRTAYAGNAISGSIPFVGAQLGTLFTFRAYSRRGVDGPTIAWALAIAGVFGALAYGIIAGSGAIISGNPFAERALAGSTGLLLISATVAWWALRRESLRPGLTRRAVRVVAWRQRVTKQFGGEPHELVAIAFERFDALRPTKGDYARVFAYAFVNCAADLATLMFCILAVGAGVPWTRLILVWVAGSTAKGVPFTPGGIGFVESAIAVALVASGLPAPTATAAAVLYRVVSFWMLLAMGWVVVGIRRLRDGQAVTRSSSLSPRT